MSQPATVKDLTANPRLFYMSQPATVEDLTAIPALPYMGQLLHGDVLTSNHVISRVSQWSWEISMTAFPISCTWVNSRAVNRLTSILLVFNLSHIQQKKDMTYS